MTRAELVASLGRVAARAFALATDVDSGVPVDVAAHEDLARLASAALARARMLEAQRPGWECDDEGGRAYLLHLPGGAAARVHRYAVATTGEGWWLWTAATPSETSGTMRGFSSVAAAQVAAEAWLQARGERLPGDERRVPNAGQDVAFGCETASPSEDVKREARAALAALRAGDDAGGAR